MSILCRPLINTRHSTSDTLMASSALVLTPLPQPGQRFCNHRLRTGTGSQLALHRFSGCLAVRRVRPPSTHTSPIWTNHVPARDLDSPRQYGNMPSHGIAARRSRIRHDWTSRWYGENQAVANPPSSELIGRSPLCSAPVTKHDALAGRNLTGPHLMKQLPVRRSL